MAKKKQEKTAAGRNSVQTKSRKEGRKTMERKTKKDKIQPAIFKVEALISATIKQYEDQSKNRTRTSKTKNGMQETYLKWAFAHCRKMKSDFCVMEKR